MTSPRGTIRRRDAWFDIDVDEKTGKITVRKADDGPAGLPVQLRRLNMIRDPEEIKKVKADEELPGGDGTDVIPGPLYEFRIQN